MGVPNRASNRGPAEGPAVGLNRSPAASPRGSAAGTARAGPELHLYSCGNTTHLLAGRKLYRIFPAGEQGLRAIFVVNLDFIPNISAVEYNAGLDLLLIATPTEGFYFLRRNNFGIGGWPAALRQNMARHLFGPLALRDGREILTDRFTFRPDGWFQPVKDSTPIWQRCLYIDKRDQVWGAVYNLPRRLTPDLHPLAVFPALDANIIDYSEDTTDGHLYCLTERSIWQWQRWLPAHFYPVTQSGKQRMFLAVRTAPLFTGHGRRLDRIRCGYQGSAPDPRAKPCTGKGYPYLPGRVHPGWHLWSGLLLLLSWPVDGNAPR